MPCKPDLLIAVEELKKYLSHQAREYTIHYREKFSLIEGRGWGLLHSSHTLLLFLLLPEEGQHFAVLCLLKPLEALHCGTEIRLDFCKMNRNRNFKLWNNTDRNDCFTGLISMSRFVKISLAQCSLVKAAENFLLSFPQNTLHSET